MVIAALADLDLDVVVAGARKAREERLEVLLHVGVLRELVPLAVGLRGMSRVAAAEWEHYGVAVHCIDPQVASPAWLKWATEYAQTAGELAAGASNAAGCERESGAGARSADATGAKAASEAQASAENALQQLSAALETPESFATRCVDLCTR